MQAKVKDDYRFNSVTAAGQDYVHGEWRPVPADWEERLADHPYLDFRSDLTPELPAAPSEVIHINPQDAQPEPLNLTNEQRAALPKLEQDPVPSEPIAMTAPAPQSETMAPAEPTPLSESDAALEAEAEADEQAAIAAEQTAAADRQAAAAKRAKKVK